MTQFPDAERSARSVLTKVVALRRELHALPEIGLDLPLTAAIVERELRALGLFPRHSGPGLVADVGDRGPLVMLRADMDALPVQEVPGRTYGSTIPGAMHACGHDAHMACLLGAATILASSRDLPFRVRLLFQPGEEGFFGARDMIAAGCLEGVAACASLHVGDLSEELSPGQTGFLHGPMMAASDRFRGAFVGRGGHGSAPSRARDPIPALAHYILALQSFRARELDQAEPAVVSICQVEAGSAFNIIPERASFMGTARSLDARLREAIEKRMTEIGQAIASQTLTRFEFEWLGGYPPLVNDARASDAMREGAVAVLGRDRVVDLKRASMGGEDFAYYLERVPGAFLFFNSQAPERGVDAPNHSPRFDVDEGGLWAPVALLLESAARLAANPRNT